MAILQKQIHSDFTVVHNAFIRDGRLTMAARGLLLTMLSLPDSWNFSIKGLSRILPEGERAISSTLKKLGELGYFKRERVTGADGRVVDWSYNFSDEPIFLDSSENPHSTSPQLQNADVVNGDVENSVVANSGARRNSSGAAFPKARFVLREMRKLRKPAWICMHSCVRVQSV